MEKKSSALLIKRYASRRLYNTETSDYEFNISGFSGHGVGSATHAGKLVAQTILNQDSTGFDAMAKVPSIPFPGGRFARSPLLIMAMTWYSLRDKFGL